VLIAGPRQFTNYPALRAALDVLLKNRLPDVVLLTAGRRGVPMLAASYATANGLELVARVPDFKRFPVDAEERRDAFTRERRRRGGSCVDRDPAVRRVLELVERKGTPIHVIGATEREPREAGSLLTDLNGLERG
jgi:hypothetical protein